MLTNLSFETADGTTPGLPASWTWNRSVPFKFESFVTTDPDPSVANPVTRFEGFELGWNNTPFVDALVVPTNATLFTFGATPPGGVPTPFESFERGWRCPNSHALIRSAIGPYVLSDGETLILTADAGEVLHAGQQASIVSAVGTTVTIELDEPITADLIGYTVTFQGAASAGNNGAFTIVSGPVDGVITITNASAVEPDANNGAIGFVIDTEPVTMTVTFHTADFANIAAATPLEVVVAILKEITATWTPLGVAPTITASFDSFGRVFVETFATGGAEFDAAGASIVVGAGTSNAALGFVAGTYRGGVDATHPGNETAIFAWDSAASAIFAAFNYAPTGSPGSPNYGQNAVGPFVPFESFERGWPSNEVFWWTFAALELDAQTQIAAFNPSAQPQENFEKGWMANEGYITVFEPQLTGSTATIIGNVGSVFTIGGLAGILPSYEGSSVAFSGASSGGNNGTFVVASVLSSSEITIVNSGGVFPDANSGTIGWLMAMTSGAFFEDGTSGFQYESFEEAKPDEGLTADHSTSTFTAVAHGLANGDLVTIYAGQTPSGVAGVLPTGINPLITYFVISAAADTFQISDTSGGSALTFSDNGNGPLFVKWDTAKYWTQTTVGI